MIVPPIRIGDIITLFDVIHEGFLFTEGVLDLDLGVIADPANFEDSLFYVQPQRQYSALRECQEFEDMYINSSPNVDAKTLKLHRILKVFFSSCRY